MSTDSKIVTVPKNGQVCLGKKYAGRHARLEFLSENQVVITFGQFIPADHTSFFTEEAEKKLKKFGEYEKIPPKNNSVEKLKASSKVKK